MRSIVATATTTGALEEAVASASAACGAVVLAQAVMMMSHSSSANDVCSIQDLSCCTQEYAAALRHSTRAMQNRLAGCFRPATAPASNLNHRRCFCIVTLRCTTCARHQLGHRRRGRMRWGDLWCVHTGDITSMYIFNLFFDGCMEFDKFDKFLN